MILQFLTLARDIISALAQLAPTTGALLKDFGPLRRKEGRPSYENVSLSLHLKIMDRAGARATLERRQVVRFVTTETGVIRDLVWGDGEAVRGYSLSGARLLGRRAEGSTTALLLVLPKSPAAGQRAEVRSTRLIQGALTRPQEFFEVRVERRTECLGLRVSFPKTRPPTDVWAVTDPPEAVKALPVRLGGDGRAYVQWRPASVKVSSLYRLAWTW